MKAVGIFALFVLLSLSSAVIIESSGISKFVNDTVTEKCTEPGIKAIYLCSGDVVKVISNVSEEGSTFHRPDGKNVTCLGVSPSQMGGECMQLMVPNYCQLPVDCREFPPPEKAPEENITVANDTATLPVNDTNETAPPPSPEPPKNDGSGPSASVLKYNGESESLLGYMAAFIAVLGIAAVSILFVLFKKSLAEEEA